MLSYFASIYMCPRCHIDWCLFFSKVCSKSGRYAFVEKGIKNDDDFTVENVYYEPRAPSPEGNI